MRKVTSKKDEYIVKCENKEQTNDVMHFFDTTSPEYPWDYWEYIINEKTLTFDDVDFIEHSILPKYSHLPVISFEEWQGLPDYDPKEVAFKDFVLPEKWSVKIDEENKSIINNWRDSELFSCYGFVNQDGFWMPELLYFNDDTVEITFEQFKKHVLGKDIEQPKTELFETKCGVKYFLDTHKPIIGYKLVKEEYKEAVKAIIDNEICFKYFDSNINKYGWNFMYVDKNDVNYWQSIQSELDKAGVLDIWFSPVYEESKETKIMDYLAEQGIEINEECASEIIKIVNNK